MLGWRGAGGVEAAAVVVGVAAVGLGEEREGEEGKTATMMMIVMLVVLVQFTIHIIQFRKCRLSRIVR